MLDEMFVKSIVVGLHCLCVYSCDFAGSSPENVQVCHIQHTGSACGRKTHCRITQGCMQGEVVTLQIVNLLHFKLSISLIVKQYPVSLLEIFFP